MIWRIGTQFLVQREDAFLVVEPTGNVVRRLAPELTSVEDDLYRTHFQVVEDQLRKHTAVERYGAPPRVSFEVVLADLVLDASPETAAFIATALGDDGVIQEEHRIRARQDAEVRVAQIAGAFDDLARAWGPVVARAQVALRDRVSRHADRDAAALLETLIALARAPVPAHVLAAFASGCLLACFAADIPPLLDGPITPHPALAARCAAHAAALASAAEAAEWSDARHTAIAYARAATAIAVAAELLGHHPAQ